MSPERTDRPVETDANAAAPEGDAAVTEPAPSNVPARTDRPADTPNVPATRPDMPLTTYQPERPAREWRQPVSVAYLPLALVAFLVLAFAMAMWTFLTATT